MVINGYDIWKRVDELNPCKSLAELSRKNGLDYLSMKQQRRDCRLPKTAEFFALSQALNVSMEYLLTGHDSRPLSEEARLVEGDDELKALVRAVRRDRRLLSAVSAVVLSYEDTEGKKA